MNADEQVFRVYINFIMTMTIWDIIDIAIMSFIIYKLLSFVRRTSSAGVIKGIILLLAVMWLSSVLHLHVINYLLGKTMELGVVVLIVIFQPEIRDLLDNRLKVLLSCLLGSLLLLLAGAAVVWLTARRAAAMRADVALTKNRRATKMARKRLQTAGDFLQKGLYTAFYEELHKALIGFISDKLNMDMSEISKDNISSALIAGGVGEEDADAFTGLLDECEFARYSPDSGNEAMNAHYETAVKVISVIDSSLKNVKSRSKVTAVIVLLLSLGAAFNASAQAGPADLWEEGVSAYSDGRFIDAATAWEGIIASGQESPEVFCNIGDAYFKQGNYPKAILNYERALKLDPSFSDARYNLEFAQGFVQDKIEAVPEFIMKTVCRKVCYTMGSDAWAVLFLVFLALTLACVLLFLLSSSTGRRRTGFWCGVAFLVLSLLCLDFSAWQKRDYKKADSAIVMSPVVSVKSSPSGGKDLFIIHEGTKVRILDSVGTWQNISLADGRQGWIEGNSIEVI